MVGTGAVNCSKSTDRRWGKALQNIAGDIVLLQVAEGMGLAAVVGPSVALEDTVASEGTAAVAGIRKVTAVGTGKDKGLDLLPETWDWMVECYSMLTGSLEHRHLGRNQRRFD